MHRCGRRGRVRIDHIQYVQNYKENRRRCLNKTRPNVEIKIEGYNIWEACSDPNLLVSIFLL